MQTDGTKLTAFDASWVNVDNSIGIVTLSGTGRMAFGEQANNNSILCSKLYPMYSTTPQKFIKDRVMEHAAVIYYSQVDSATTARLAAEAISLSDQMPDGWNGLIVSDPDGERNLIIANLCGGSNNRVKLKDVTIKGLGAPVLSTETFITDSRADATINLDDCHALMQPLTVFIQGDGVAAKLFNPWDDNQLYVRSLTGKRQTVIITAMRNGKPVSTTQTIDGTIIIRLDNN